MPFFKTIQIQITLLLSIILCQPLITFAQQDSLPSPIDFNPFKTDQDTTWKAQPQVIFEVGHGVSKNNFDITFAAIPEMRVQASNFNYDITIKQQFHVALQYAQKIVHPYFGFHAALFVERKLIHDLDKVIFANSGINNPQFKRLSYTTYGVKVALFYELPIQHPKLYVRPYLCAAISQNISDLPPTYSRVPGTDLVVLTKENTNQNPAWYLGVGTNLGHQFSKHFFVSARVEFLYIYREQRYDLKIGPIQDKYIDFYNRVKMKNLDFKVNVGIGYIMNFKSTPSHPGKNFKRL